MLSGHLRWAWHCVLYIVPSCHLILISSHMGLGRTTVLTTAELWLRVPNGCVSPAPGTGDAKTDLMDTVPTLWRPRG